MLAPRSQSTKAPRSGRIAIRLAVAALILAGAQRAQALPSYARQTGQQCVACHNGFPELTPYGRQFKLNGYTFGNSDAPDPPLAAMIISTYTHTQKPEPAPIVPGTGRNNNLEADAFNFYLAGKILPNLGVFIQGLYTPLGRNAQWFTTDIRYADSLYLFGKDMTYGLSVNNNPGITDPWNTALSFWSYPYETSHVLPQPVASTAIQGRYMNQVIGANLYASWDRFLYADVGVYRKIDPGTLNAIGIDTLGASAIDGDAPYWRLAMERGWGHSTLEVGHFGMSLSVDPHRIATAGTDRTIDVGFDSEYQYLADKNSVSIIGSYIHEHSSLGASRALAFSTNKDDDLNAVNIKGTYYYDQTYGGNLGYFETTGSRDRGLYGPASLTGSPDTAGWIAELDYYPFNRGGPEFWRQLNFKVGLQYTAYTKYDGAASNYNGLGRNAGDNNSLFLYVWSLF
jgi:hypothetical protein